jgi:hypothetical protein
MNELLLVINISNYKLIKLKHMKNKKLPMFVLGALLLGAGGSIAVQTFAQTPVPVQPSVVASSQTDQNIDQKDAQGNDVETNDDQYSKVTTPVKVSEDQAKQIALTANAGTKVVSVELEQHRGNAVYEISLDNKVEVKIDANTGTVLKSHIEGAESKDNHVDEKDANGNDIETNDGPDAND